MKKVIRLTESDLHRVIKESVKQVMNELDWRTYDSAAEKSRERYYDAPTREEEDYHKRRFNKFTRASDDAFEKKFGTYKFNPNEPTSDREAVGKAQYAIHKRGGDEYIPGKGYRKKS